jgi:ribosomal protein S18 acetylase RimI-like enzyme
MTALSAIDHERFGIVTARDPHVTAESLGPALAFCRANHVKMFIARCKTEDLVVAQGLEQAGGRLMDTLVYFVRPLDRGIPDEGTLAVVRPLREGEADEVRRVATESFRGYFGHYHADHRLDRAKCDEAYASWAYRSCLDREVASQVLVAENEGRIAGFLTLLHRGPEEQEIILNGVEPRAQRHGIYRALVLAALRHARADGARQVSISTQITNLAVQKTWTRLGFEPARSYYTFHLWVDRP